METKESILLEVIPKIRAYLMDDTISCKSYQDFIANNRDLFICNLYSINLITEEDIRLLYITMQQNINIDDKLLVVIFSYIGYDFEKNIQCEQSIDIKDGGKTADMTYNIYHLFFSVLDFIIIHKKVHILVNNEDSTDMNINYKNTSDLTSLEPSNIKPRINEIPFNMKELLSFIAKNLDQLRFSKKYLDFAYLCRNIGIGISKRKFNVRYIFNYPLDTLVIPIVIKDYLDIKHVYLTETNKVYKNNFEVNSKNFYDWGKLIIAKLSNPRIYSYFFLSNYGLCDLFLELLAIIPAIFTLHNLRYQYLQNILYWPLDTSIQSTICEHEIKFMEAKKIHINYYNNISKFIFEYIMYDDGLAYCKLCSVNLPELNLDTADITKIATMAITYNTSIFTAEPYSYFSHSQRFIFNIIMSFDTIMKAQTWSIKYNINRLILNFLIDINSKRHIYEKRFSEAIKHGIFFLRLSANLFDIQMSSMELFYDAKIFNLHFIVSFIIVLNSGADFILSYLPSNAIKNNDLTTNISIIIFDFLKKTRICNKQQFDKILLFTNTYLEISPEELQIYYNKLRDDVNRLNTIKRGTGIANYDINIYKDMLRDDQIYFFESKQGPTERLYPLKETKLYTVTKIIRVPNLTKAPSTTDSIVFDNIINSTKKVLIRINDTNTSNIIFLATHVRVDAEKRKIIIPLSLLFIDNILKYYASNSIFYVFKFGDPFPFSDTLISSEHRNYKINGYNQLIHFFLPEANNFAYHDTDLSRYNLEFAFYMFLSSYVVVTDWIEENSSKIKELYIINFNN